MIERARQAVAEAGLEDRDIDLRVAAMEESRLPDKSADVVLSNCVVNLCPDKGAVYKEAFRILRAGGRLAISDIVLTENIDAEARERFQSTWAGCFGGAVPEADYWRTVRKAGFAGVRVVARHTLAPEELEAMARCPGEEYGPAPAKEDLARAQGKAVSIKFTAVKPSFG
jgi:SAM-dependent methyltransferase